ncbi:MAG TPA: MmgE/PrpD family protein [Gaiellaceae bacterium]
MSLKAAPASSTTIGDRLAQFSIDLRPDDVPDPILRQAELSTLDFFGVVLAGSRTPAGELVGEYVRELGGANEASIIGSRDKVPVASAALVNGTRSHSIELDDHEAHMRSKVHPGVVVMPTAWAVAETRPVSGAEFLAAVIIGYDVIGRLSAATSYPDFLGRTKGFHTTGLFGGFAAAATAGRLLGLTAEQLSNAFGICGSMCSGIQETVNAGAMMKCFHAGWAAQSGLTAARLASRGYTGPRSIFEGRKGFFRAYCGEENYDLAVIEAGLGETFDISYIMYKPYACAGGIHPSLTAVEKVREEHEFSYTEVESVVVRTSEGARNSFSTPREVKCAPPSGTAAQHSMLFAVATLLVDGVALIEQFTDDAVRRPEVLDLAQRVTVEADPDIHSDDPEDEPAAVTVRLKNGAVLEAYARGGLGSLAVPMSESQLIDKYRLLASSVVGSDAAAAVEARALAMRDEQDVSDLPAVCVAPE